MSDSVDHDTPTMQQLSTVIPIKKKREKAKTDTEKKPKAEELFWRLRQVIDHSPFSPFEDFPHKFMVYHVDENNVLTLTVDERGVCTAKTPDALARLVASYLEERLIKSPGDYWVFSASKLREFVDLWISYAQPVPEPKPWTFKSSTELAFARLPWDPEPGPTPTWDSFLVRSSDPNALKAYLGSLFVDESDRQQYLWLYGEGNDGKGSLFRFLHRCFGSAFANEYAPGKNVSQFWTSGLLNKRVVAFPDCNNYDFVTSGLFKSLTGGDPVRVERKGDPAFTALIHAKFLFGSNEYPKVSGEKSDIRRLIFIEMTSMTNDPDPKFESRLWDEGGRFIHACLEAYRNACPDHSIIRVDVEAVDNISSQSEADLASACDLFNFSSTLSCTQTSFYNSVRWRLSDRRIGDFKKYLKRVHGVTIKKAGNPRVMVVLGMAPKITVDPPLLRGP